MNEFKVVFDEENNEVTFTTNIQNNIIDTHFILSQLSDEQFQSLVLSKTKLIFNEYKKRILDED